MAEIINSRDYQEDRTTAKASVEEEAKRIKDRVLSGAPPNSSFHLDVRIHEACVLYWWYIMRPCVVLGEMSHRGFCFFWNLRWARRFICVGLSAPTSSLALPTTIGY